MPGLAKPPKVPKIFGAFGAKRKEILCKRKVPQAKSLIVYRRVDGPRLEFGTQNVEKKAENGVSKNGVRLPLRGL